MWGLESLQARLAEHAFVSQTLFADDKLLNVALCTHRSFDNPRDAPSRIF